MVPASLDEIVKKLHVEFVVLDYQHSLRREALHWSVVQRIFQPIVAYGA
jgi:hypothetical protein